MNIYFFGGSFDPPHLGHLKMIETCFEKFDISHFILIPAFQSPLKKNKPIASAFHRIEMLKIMIKDVKGKIIIDDYEVSKKSFSYTYDTIKHFKKKYPDDCFSMLLGKDQFLNIKKWKNYEKILNSVKIIVFNRLNKKEMIVDQIDAIQINDFDFNISSRRIREKFNNCESVINDLPMKINNYINKNQIYKIKQ